MFAMLFAKFLFGIYNLLRLNLVLAEYRTCRLVFPDHTHLLFATQENLINVSISRANSDFVRHMVPWQREENLHNVYGWQFHIRIIFRGIMIRVNL